jgi:two-component system sensor histidine kinase NreB
MIDDTNERSDGDRAPELGPEARAEIRRSALRLALTWAAFGVVWVALSDRLADALAPTPHIEDVMQTFKGMAFIVASAVLLYLLARGAGERVREAQRRSIGHARELERSQERYRHLVEMLPGVVYRNEIDADERALTRCVYISPRIDDVLGYTPQEWIADPDLWIRVVHPGDREAVLAENEAADSKGVATFEYRAIRKDGGHVWIHDEGVFVDGDGDHPGYWQGVMIDVTAQRVADAGIHELAESLRSVFAAAPVAILVMDADSVVRQWNPAAEQMFGWTAAEAIGQPLPVVPMEDWRGHLELRDRVLERNDVAGLELTRRRKDGSDIAVELWTAPMRTADGEVAGIVTIFEDVTDRRRTEQERQQLRDALAERADDLARLADERQQMLRRVVTAQEAERERVALELHDGLGQILTSISLFASDLENEVPAKARGRVTRVNELVRRAIADSRQLVWSLRPPELERLGLVPALRRLVEETTAETITVDLHEEIGELRLDVETEAVVYRVVQEAVNNAIKHAGASAISILLRRRGDVLSTIVEDNGRGFDIEAIRPGRGLGLIGMRERAELVGGAVVIESSADAGTTVRLEVAAGPPSRARFEEPDLAHNGNGVTVSATDGRLDG